MSRRDRAALLVLLTVIITIGGGSAAIAHANYRRSDPAPNAHLVTPPTRVLVGFSENVLVASSGLALLDQDAHEVAAQSGPTSDPTELALPLPALRDGVYTVAWHTVSAADGDAAKGYFAFEVGTAVASTAPPVAQTKTTPDGIAVALAVSPDVAGKNGYRVSVTRGGSPLANVIRVRLRFTPLDRDVGQTDLVLAPAADGPATFAGSGYEMPFSGRYRVQVQVRRPDLADLTLDFELAVRTADASPTPAPGAAGLAASAPVAVASPAAAPEQPGSVAALATVLALVLAVAIAIALAVRRRG